MYCSKADNLKRTTTSDRITTATCRLPCSSGGRVGSHRFLFGGLVSTVSFLEVCFPPRPAKLFNAKISFESEVIDNISWVAVKFTLQVQALLGD